MKRFRTRFVIAGIVAVGILAVTFAIKGRGAEGAFGSANPSPIAKNDEVMQAWNVQKAFRSIQDMQIRFISRIQHRFLSKRNFYSLQTKNFVTPVTKR